jgi:hypothetical protein
MRSIRAALARASVVLAVLVLVPSAVFAQVTITGIVKDTSGAVLPGVTVEAASPVLIERARSTVTDASVSSASSISVLARTQSRSRGQDSPPSSATASN